MPTELRQRAVELELEAEVSGPDGLGPEDFEGAAALLAALAGWDPALLRRALLGETGQSNAGSKLLERAIEIAEDETGGAVEGGG